MNDQKNQQQGTGNSGQQNPTLDSPGSQVADYGNTTGGTASEIPQQDKGTSNPQRGNSGEANESDTVGNP